MKQVRMDIDELSAVCGHATDSDYNNGYGCDHSDNNVGGCHRRGCPMANYDERKDEMIVYDKGLLASLIKSKPIEELK